MANIDPKWGSWAEAPPPISEEDIRESLSCDVAVLGAGIAGVACALRAAQKGLKVIVLEKGASWSGRGGNIGVPNSKFMRAQGFENRLEDVAREWIKRCGNRCDEELVWLFLRNGERAMDWLLDIVTAPEYGCRPALQACLYRGETYREIYGSHRLFDGPMARKGLRPGGADAVYSMYSEACKLGVTFLFHTPAVWLEKDGDRVVSAIGRQAEGCVRVSAAKGVVLATGDIGGNAEMCRDLAPYAERSAVKIYMPKGGNTGDGHRLGLWAGGAFEDGPFPLMLHPQAYHLASYCFLFVDNNGKRFMNEDNFIQGKGIAMLRRHMTYAWSIMDGDWREKVPQTLEYGGGLFWGRDHAPDEEDFDAEYAESLITRSRGAGYVCEADTPEELAAQMGVPADNFVETLRRHNENAAKGRDEDFGKRPELLFPLDKPPYIALKFGPALLAVVGGLKVNTALNVTDDDAVPIPGLYAIGNAMGGRYGVDYPMLLPGNSHGTALTYGCLLGEMLAQ